MTPKAEHILKEALELPSSERANLVNSLLSSLDKPDKTIDKIWKEEVENRISAYKSGKMETVSVEEVLAKYKNK